MNTRIFGVALVVLLAGCSRHEDRNDAGTLATAASLPVAASSASGPAAPDAPVAAPVPADEPSEDVLRKLEFETYASIENAGGMPVTMTATGQSLTLHPKLYEVRKEKCSPTPQAPAGWYECELTIKLSLSPDGSDPSEQGERIGVKWDPRGEWVRQ